MNLTNCNKIKFNLIEWIKYWRKYQILAKRINSEENNRNQINERENKSENEIQKVKNTN